MKLRGRYALITGASRGLGRRVARLFWEEGAHLLLVARTQPDLLSLQRELLATGHKDQSVHVLPLDLTHADAVKTVVDHVERQGGQLDTLVNNAGNQGPIGPVWDNDWNLWEYCWRLNFVVPVALCRAAVPFFGRRGSGAVINISGGGATAPRPNFTAYAAAKVAIVRFSETFAEEVRPLHVKVNSMAPGPMFSRMQECVLEAGPRQAGEKDFRLAQELKAKAPTLNDEVIERAARLCVFLASSQSDGITGKLISAVWDPWTTLSEHPQDLDGSDIYTLRRIVPKDRGLAWGDV